jgi:hypothetical protein
MSIISFNEKNAHQGKTQKLIKTISLNLLLLPSTYQLIDKNL